MKKNVNALLTLCCLFLFSQTNAQRTYVTSDHHETFNSARATLCYKYKEGALLSSNYAATRNSPFVEFRAHLTRVLHDGAVKHSKRFEAAPGEDFRVFSVAGSNSFPHDWAAVGTTGDTAQSRGVLFVVDDDLNVIRSTSFYHNTLRHTHVLDVEIHNTKSGQRNYYVTGYATYTRDQGFTGVRQSFVIKFDGLLNVVWEFWFDSGTPNADFDLAESVKVAHEHQSGDVELIVTGSRNASPTLSRGRTLALVILDQGGAYSYQDISFEALLSSPIFKQTGADVFVDYPNFYLVWSEEWNHIHHVMKGQLNGPSMLFSQAIEFSPQNQFVHGGFQIFEDKYDPDYLVTVGYENPNSVNPFSLKFRKDGTGTPLLQRYLIPNNDASAFRNNPYTIMPWQAFASTPQGSWEYASVYTSEPAFQNANKDIVFQTYENSAQTSSQTEAHLFNFSQTMCAVSETNLQFGSLTYQSLPEVQDLGGQAIFSSISVQKQPKNVGTITCQGQVIVGNFYPLQSPSPAYCGPRSSPGPIDIIGPGNGIALKHGGTTAIDKANSVTVNVYPNPVKGHLNIESLNEVISVKVLNTIGKEELLLKGDRKTIDLSSLAKGVYIMIIEDVEGNSITKRIMKE